MSGASPAVANARWNEAVSQAYRLQIHCLETDNFRFDIAIRSPLFGKRIAVTGPYATDGGVFAKTGRLDTGDYQALERFRRKHRAAYVLVKARQESFGNTSSPFSMDTGYATSILDLRGGVEHVWKKKLKSKTRNQTRKGQRLDCALRVGGPELLTDYLAVIRQRWKELGTPTHSAKLHRSLLRAFGKNARLMMLYDGKQPVSAAMLLVTGTTLHHPFCATLREYHRSCAGNAMYWHIIEWACEQNLQYFDLGRSPISSGGAKYKASWGAESFPLHYAYVLGPRVSPPALTDSPVVQFATRAWTRLPLPIANRLGPHFIKNVL